MEIPKFKLEVSDYINKAEQNLLYNGDKATKDLESYIKRSFSKIIDKPVFREKRNIAEDLFRSFCRQRIETIDKEISEMVNEQIQEMKYYLVKCISEYETMSTRDIEETIYTAQNNITKITDEKFEKFRTDISRKLEDVFNQYTQDARVRPELKDLIDAKDSYMFDLKNNFDSVKKEFVNNSRGEVQSAYNNSKITLVKEKLSTPEKENSELKEADKKDELMTQITPEQEVAKKSVTEADLGCSFANFEVIQEYMKVFDPNFRVDVEGGFVVATDEGGTPYVIQQKDDVISFKSQTDNDRRYGLKINPDEQSISVYKGDSVDNGNLVCFETSTNTVTLAYQTEGERKDYEFHFENGEIIVFELKGEEKLPANYEEVKIQIQSAGLEIEPIMKISSDLSIEGPQRS